MLFEVKSIDAVLRLYRALEVRPAGVVDIVPAARTVLITYDPRRLAPDSILEWVRGQEQNDDDGAPLPRREVTLDVNYSGPDLREVAGVLGISVEEIVELHTASTWTAAFTGFAPGFAYLVTDHARLNVPRRDSPRTSVPAGSVGLAGEFSGVYPRKSPGGWQLIGRTEAELWDPSAESPALLEPGCTVRFRAL
nr:allophanate hydrolase subunit 1 [Arthrobacter pigmenti]